MLQYRSSRRWPTPIPRARVLALILGAGGLVVVLLAALVLSAYHLVHPLTSSFPLPPGVNRNRGVSAAVARARDDLAARAMPDTATGHEYGQPELSTRDPGARLHLPPARGVDSLGVATGFPQTPLGALSELIAIDTAVLQSASLPMTRAVITAWAAPGGPSAQSWSGVKAMAAFLESAGVSGAGSPRLRVAATAAMGLIKGQVGDDFVVPCVDFSIDVTRDGATDTGVSVDCQRMLWLDGRWVIGPGAEPAPATQVWPDTDPAIATGFRDLAPRPT